MLPLIGELKVVARRSWSSCACMCGISRLRRLVTVGTYPEGVHCALAC